VIPLPPEFIQAQDGAEKQDCEINAAKRWMVNGFELVEGVILDLFGRV
jgi:hypothetical protein